MRVIIERTKNAQVSVDGTVVGSISSGYLLLVAFTHDDTLEKAEKMAAKILNLRIMSDENDKMNLTIADVRGQILSVPQFTLYADTSGRRPGFSLAAKPDHARALFQHFNVQLAHSSVPIESGIFGAHMVVTSENDGPLTLILES